MNTLWWIGFSLFVLFAVLDVAAYTHLLVRGELKDKGLFPGVALIHWFRIYRKRRTG